MSAPNFTENYISKLQVSSPLGGATAKVRGFLKSVSSILHGDQAYRVQNVMATRPLAVEIFRSGPKWKADGGTADAGAGATRSCLYSTMARM